jgi:hypothetical protein
MFAHFVENAGSEPSQGTSKIGANTRVEIAVSTI